MVEQSSFSGGLNLEFVPTAAFESLESTDVANQLPIIARNLLRLLMNGWDSSWRQLINFDTLKALLIRRDAELIRELRFAMQQGFEHLFSQLVGKSLDAHAMEQVQLYLSNCMSILPYADLTPYESISIPQFIDGAWILVEYGVTPIELTESQSLKGFFLQDEDRVFAYGLEAIEHPKATSHLIFHGTTYPAGQGFTTQVRTDLEGFNTVGKSLYLSGRERIKRWVQKQQDKIHVCGVSLGGSLSLLMAIDQGESVSRVDALNPAGLHEPWFFKDPYDQWDEMAAKPKVVIQQQEGDPVSPFGSWKADWELFKVIPPEEKKGPNPFIHHISNYASYADTKFEPLDPEELNKDHKPLNIILYSIARGIYYYTVLLPYNYLIRPIFNLVWNYKLATGLILLAAATLITLATLGIISVILAAAIFVPVLCLIVFTQALLLAVDYPDTLADYYDYAQLHQPDLPRNQSMDIYDMDNTMELELSHSDVHTYYHSMRCLVKEKTFIPDESSKAFVGGVNKRELLIASEDPAHSDEKVTLKVTKAKGLLMKSTLFYTQQLKDQPEEVLKEKLAVNYDHYRIGKH